MLTSGFSSPSSVDLPTWRGPSTRALRLESRMRGVRSRSNTCGEYRLFSTRTRMDAGVPRSGISAVAVGRQRCGPLEKRLAAFDPARHGGELMGTRRDLGAERW